MRHIILTNKLKGPLGRLPRALSYHPLNILTRRHSRDDTVSTSFLYKRSCVTGVPGKHCAGMPVTTCLDEPKIVATFISAWLLATYVS